MLASSDTEARAAASPGSSSCVSRTLRFALTRAGSCAAAELFTPPLRPQTYGMLIYKLLGDSAQQEFARSWGISYGLNAATEWKARMWRCRRDAPVVLLQHDSLFATLPRLTRRTSPWRPSRALSCWPSWSGWCSRATRGACACGCIPILLLACCRPAAALTAALRRTLAAQLDGRARRLFFRAGPGICFEACSALPLHHAKAAPLQRTVVQALLFKQTSLGFVGQIGTFFKNTRRITA
jgi:hypothetical protein